MENAPTALAGLIPATGSVDDESFKAWTMGKSLSASDSPGDKPHGHAAVADTLTEIARERTSPSTVLTLRVKPDRRRIQIPIPAELDRRRKT
jgi:hypothetical protein